MEKKTRPPRNFAPTKLKAARLKAGLSQSNLAERTGLNVRTLQHYEQGSKNFDLVKFNVIINTCLVLNCRVEDIIENEETIKLFQEYNKKY